MTSLSEELRNNLIANTCDKERLVSLIEQGADVNWCEGGPYPGHSSLTLVIDFDIGNEIEVVEILIKYGASVNHRDMFGVYPLLLSIQKERHDISILLLENGANPNIIGEANRSPLQLVCLGYEKNVTNNLCYLCEDYHILVELLLANNASVNHQDRHGNTVLMDMCICRYDYKVSPLPGMKLLLDHPDIDIDLVNNGYLSGQTALGLLTSVLGENDILKIELFEDHIFQKKLLIVQKRLALGKLFYSSLGENLVEEGLYEKISSFV